MKIREYAIARIKSTPVGVRLVEDLQYRTVAKAVLSLIGNLIFALYNGLLGFLSSSFLFAASAVYYLLLSVMRFCVVTRGRKNDRRTVFAVGVMLVAVSIVFHIMVIVSMKYQTASVYGTIPMIAIATYTFTKITVAAVTAVKHRQNDRKLFKAINAIRYSEVAVSLLTMQQSMLVSFGEGTDSASVILNACTGAGVCFFIFTLGILTLKAAEREVESWQKRKS